MTPCRRAHVHAGLLDEQVLLQRLGAASVQLLPSPQLSLFASGLDSDVSGLVLQVGYSDTTALPICHRVPLVQSASIAKLGSKTLHACLYQLALQVVAHDQILICVLSVGNRRLRAKLYRTRTRPLSRAKTSSGRIRIKRTCRPMTTSPLRHPHQQQPTKQMDRYKSSGSLLSTIWGTVLTIYCSRHARRTWRCPPLITAEPPTKAASAPQPQMTRSSVCV